ncbi:MAG: phosphoglycerate mutase family protein [Methylomonas sp.]|jgi:phosphohistidine phosphatase SixA
MIITLLRHATAEEGGLTVPDAERALTEKGVKQVKRVAAFCQANQLSPGALFSSPILRALQTARILQTQLAACPVVAIADWLGLNASPQRMVAELNALAARNKDDIWLVGHEPSFSDLIGFLLKCSGDNFNIKKASLTRIDMRYEDDMPTASLLWSIPCSLLS